MEPSNDNKKVRVWVVEDNEPYRRTLSRILGFTPDCRCDHMFGSAEAALQQLILDGPPDVLLLDIGLPGIDGITAIGRFRQLRPDLKIVILTVFDDHDRIFAAVCAGADGYLLKTSSSEDIERAIIEVSRGGASMTPQVAKKVLALMSTQRPRSGENDAGLTGREMDVLKFLVEGLTKAEIGDRLGISPHTVDKHVRGIYQKLHVNTRAEATAAAMRQGLV